MAAFSSAASSSCVLPATYVFTNMSANGLGYAWNFGNGTSSNVASPSVEFVKAGTYPVTLVVTSGVGCADTASANIVVNNAPNAGFNMSQVEGCAPMLVSFGNTTTNGFNYKWNFGNGTTSTLSSPAIIYEQAGSYQVTLVVSDQSGCVDTVDASSQINVLPSPTADFTTTSTSFPEPGTEFEFVNNSVGAELYNWTFGNGAQTDEFQPIYEYTSFGGYFVTLTAINEFGCADTSVEYVSVQLQKNMYVPNAMVIGQPGEAGIFLPKGGGLIDYHIRVFDKWGAELWESTALNNGHPAEGWDGIYKGQYVPQGAYVWKIVAVFEDGEAWQGIELSNGSTSITGTITVLY
ncbi:PKD domain-containing protein [Bacteroidota bacterium]